MADTEPAPEAPVNATGKIPATPEGMMVAYGSLVIMALIPIFLGSFRSIESQKEQKENHVSYQLDPSYSVWIVDVTVIFMFRRKLEKDQRP